MRSLAQVLIVLSTCPFTALLAGEADGLAGRVAALEEELGRLRATSPKVATLSRTEVLDYLDEWRDRNAQLLALRRQMQDDLAKMGQEMKALRDTIGVMADGDEKNKRQATLVALERQYSAKYDTNRKELDMKNDRYLAQVLNKVAEHTAQLAKADGFDLVILRHAILYQGKDLADITQKVIESMNEEYAAEKEKAGTQDPQPEPPKDEPKEPDAGAEEPAP